MFSISRLIFQSQSINKNYVRTLSLTMHGWTPCISSILFLGKEQVRNTIKKTKEESTSSDEECGINFSSSKNQKRSDLRVKHKGTVSLSIFTKGLICYFSASKFGSILHFVLGGTKSYYSTTVIKSLYYMFNSIISELSELFYTNFHWHNQHDNST